MAAACEKLKATLREEMMERIKRSSDDEDDPSPPRKKFKPIRHVEHDVENDVDDSE